MLGFANDGLMIPEQIWDKPEVPKNYDHEWVPDLKFGEGTGSATPLAWSMAQFIRLASTSKPAATSTRRRSSMTLRWGSNLVSCPGRGQIL